MARVRDPELDVVATHLRAHREGRGAVADGVVQQVVDRLGEAHLVRLEDGAVRHVDTDVGGGTGGLPAGCGAPDQLRERHALPAGTPCPALQLGGSGQVGGEPAQSLRAAPDAAEELVALAGRHLALRHLEGVGAAVDDGRGVPQLVGRDGEQARLLGHGLHPVVGVLPLLGLVAGDLREPDVQAPVVVDRADDDAGPEPGAVPAHAPALLGERPVAQRCLEVALRVPRQLLLRGVEDPEVAPDDLVGAVALDPARACVPAHHPSSGVEHEHGVLLDRGDQEPELLLGAVQLVLDGALGADVLHLREHVEHLADRVPDRDERHEGGADVRRSRRSGDAVLERGDVLLRGPQCLEAVVQDVAQPTGQAAVVDARPARSARTT